MSEDNNINPAPEDSYSLPEPKKPAELTKKIHTLDLEKDYTPPLWSAKPTKNYFVEVIKNGVIVGTEDLNVKPFYLVGKLQDLCDIVLEHQSISRKHAVFQHKDDGSLYIYDLGSTHGTKINKTVLVPKVFQKLRVGDVIKFGSSSRLYIVGLDGSTEPLDGVGHHISPIDYKVKENEEQPSSEKVSLKEKYLELLKGAGHLRAKIPTKVVHNIEEVSWGMVDEDEIRAYEDEEDIKLDPDLLRELPGLESKDYDKINNYEKKLKQYQNLERELEYINKKEREEYGLSETEKVKRQALEDKVNDAFSKLQMMEDNLKFALFREAKTAKDRIAKRREADTFEDDEFYDRTIKKLKTEDDDSRSKAKAKQLVEEGETFESLKSKLESYITKRQELNEKILNLSLNIDLEQNEKEAGGEVDEFEEFMKENNKKVKSESKGQLLSELKELNHEITEVQKLLKFVKPSFNTDVSSVEKRIEEKKLEEKKAQPQNVKPQPKPQPQIKPQQKPSLSETISQMKQKNPDTDQNEEAQRELNPPPKKKVYGAPMRPPSRNLKEADYENQDHDDVEWVPPEEHESL